MKPAFTKNGAAALLTMVLLGCLTLGGCGTTPEKEAANRQSDEQKLQRKYASYTTPQLQLKRQQIASTIPAWYWGTGFAGMIQQGQIEGKKKEVAEIDQELPRRVESGDKAGKKMVTFVVTSDPPGARIELDGQFNGLTPNIITGAVDLASSITIRATPANLDRPPMLGFVTGLKYVNGSVSPDPSTMGVCSIVSPNTPASRMGLTAGDKIVAVNGVVLPHVSGDDESAAAWLAAYDQQISRAGFGGDVTLKVLRNGAELDLQGQNYEQSEGVYYVQEKVIRPSAFAGKVIFFDMRAETGTRILLGGGAGSATGPKGGTFTGTGFAVAEGGYVLTCQHVIAKSEQIEIRDATGAKHKAKVIASDAGNDLCLLKAEGLDIKPIPSAPPNSVSTGETIYSLGFPMEGVLENHNPVAGAGVVASLRGLKGDPRHLQVTVPINPGNSGGPVLDVYGRWVAVASHKLNDFYSLAKTESIPQGINFAIKGTLAVPLFDSIPEVKLPVGEGKEKLSLEDVTKQLSGGILFITASH